MVYMYLIIMQVQYTYINGSITTISHLLAYNFIYIIRITNTFSYKMREYNLQNYTKKLCFHDAKEYELVLLKKFNTEYILTSTM